MVKQLSFQIEEGGSIPTSPLQFNIEEISRYAAREFNARWHSRLPIYRTGFCLNAKVCYGAYFEGELFAIAIWTNPVARLLPQIEWLELRRMAIKPAAPKNTASRMLAVMARLIRMGFPEVTTLISYQDAEVHQGTIYKASGWSAISHHSGGTWNRPNSKNSSNGKPRTRPDLNDSLTPKIRWQKELN